MKGGFELPESKGGVAWRDADTIYIARDFGPGTLTRSGYPRMREGLEARHAARRGRDGLRGRATRTSAPGRSVDAREGLARTSAVTRAIATRCGERVHPCATGKLGEARRARATPTRVTASGMLYVRLREDWKPAEVDVQGGLAASPIDLEKFLAGERDFDVLFEPRDRACRSQALRRH